MQRALSLPSLHTLTWSLWYVWVASYCTVIVERRLETVQWFLTVLQIPGGCRRYPSVPSIPSVLLAWEACSKKYLTMFAITFFSWLSPGRSNPVNVYFADIPDRLSRLLPEKSIVPLSRTSTCPVSGVVLPYVPHSWWLWLPIFGLNSFLLQNIMQLCPSAMYIIVHRLSPTVLLYFSGIMNFINCS